MTLKEQKPILKPMQSNRYWKAITLARSKARPKATLTAEQVETLIDDVHAGMSYYAAGKKQGVSGAAARYHWLKATEDPK